MNLKRIFIISIISLSIILVAYSVLIEPYQIEITNLKIENSHLNKVLKGKIAIHLTDLHIGAKGRRERKVLEIINLIKPDLIFLTGDYVQWKGDYNPSLSFFSKLQAPVGVWAVMGDYDYSSSRKSCLFCHKAGTKDLTDQHQVKFLRNSFEKIEVPAGQFMLGGIDKMYARSFPSVPDNVASIVLSHNPMAFDSIDDQKNIFMLAGDTHGGQISLPLWFWKLTGYEKMYRYRQGLFEQGKKKMYVSRGIGTSHFPIRFLRRPEVVVLHF
jgi:uncharacterized protein